MTPFIAAALISYLLTPLAISFARRYGLVTDSRSADHPAHTHTGTIPRAGALPIYLSLALLALISIPIQKNIIGVLAGGLLLVITGLLDDKYNLSPYLRFGINAVAACLTIAGGLGIPYITNPFGEPFHLIEPQIVFTIGGELHTIWVLADVASILWLMFLMNVVNWSKGVDGQLPGYVSVAALFLGLTAARFSAHELSAAHTQTLAFITAGAFAGFLPWNFYPQRIMPGYGGGSLAGFMLGVLSILSFGKIGALMIVLAVPLLDGVYTLLRRIIAGKNPFRGDDRHLHHLLLRAGWGRRRIAVFYMGITACLGAATLFLSDTWAKILFVGVVYLALTYWIRMLSVRFKKDL